MKTIGLIGGMTWLSTAEYYSLINHEVHQRLGGVHSARIALQSLDFGQIKACIDCNDWRTITEIMVGAAKSVELAGADCIVMCANTAHKVAGEVRAVTRLPLIHIAEETARVLKEAGIARAGLLGTRFTMMDPFFRDALSLIGIEAIVPNDDDCAFVHSSILDEMAKGIFLPSTKARYLDVIEKLTRDGAEGIIEGCTEIPLLIKPEDCALPLFDTTVIHAHAAVDFALEG